MALNGTKSTLYSYLDLLLSPLDVVPGVVGEDGVGVGQETAAELGTLTTVITRHNIGRK